MEHGVDQKVLENVPILAWGKSGDCTFIGAMEAATAVTPYPAIYQALMGATGLAFRTRWFKGPEGQRWCPSSPVGEMREESEAASKASGWPMRIAWDDQPMARLAPDIRASIDKGLPILCYDDELNMSVIYGYEEGGEAVLLRSYIRGETPLRLATSDLKMFVLFLEDHVEPLSPREAALQGIRMGVKNFRRRHDPEEDEARGYWFGQMALTQWAEDIARAEEYSEADRGFLFFVSWWNFEGLMDARRNAGPFLCQVAALFPPPAQAALERAASIYADEVKLLSRSFTHKDTFLGPWAGGEDVRQWTDAVRQREREMLARAATIEEDAIRELESALTLI